MAAPDDRKYSKSHEWHKPEGDLVAIGISQFAVEELTDITYLELTVESGPIQAGQSFGEIESVKATSELYCGISGEVVEVNSEVVDNPAIINEDCYGKGWMIKVKPANNGELDNLLDAESYGREVAS